MDKNKGRLLACLKEAFDVNDYKMLDEKETIQFLDMRLENMEKDTIKDIIDELIKKGELYKPKKDSIKLISNN